MGGEAHLWPPLVWVVIPTWNRRKDVLACLASVAALTYPRVEVLVVDNASDDGTVQAIERSFPTVSVLVLESNRGATVASNAGFRLAMENGADYAFRLDSDALVHPETVTLLVAAAKDRPSVGILVPTIYYADQRDRVWFAGADAHPWHFGARNAEWYREAVRLTHEAMPVDYAWATGMLLSRQALALTGGFDDDFVVYYEEVDLCLRARAQGIGVCVVPSATLWHQVRVGPDSPWRARQWNRSKLLLYRKHSRGLHYITLVAYALAYALYRALRPAYGKGNRGPLLSALKGIADGLRYPLAR